jgi:hypothetical protein
MVHSKQVKHAVKHENAYFLVDAMPELRRLRLGTIDRYGDVAEFGFRS